MIIKDALGHTAEVHLYDNDTGMDFVEEYLNAGPLTVMLMVPTWWKMSTTLTTMPPKHVTAATPILKRL